MKLKAFAIITLIIGFILVSSPDILAGEGDRNIRFGVFLSSPTSDLVVDGETTEADSAFGLHAGFEHMFSDKIGIEASILSTSYDIKVNESGFPELEIGDVSLMAVTANVNFHLLRDKTYDLYVGPTIGFAFWGDLKTDIFPENFPTDDDFIVGGKLGVDIPLGEGKWGFSGSLSYLLSDIALEGGSEDIGLDPIMIQAGLVYSF